MQAQRGREGGRENGWRRGVEMEAWTVNARGPVQLLVKAPDDLCAAVGGPTRPLSAARFARSCCSCLRNNNP